MLFVVLEVRGKMRSSPFCHSFRKAWLLDLSQLLTLLELVFVMLFSCLSALYSCLVLVFGEFKQNANIFIKLFVKPTFCIWFSSLIQASSIKMIPLWKDTWRYSLCLWLIGSFPSACLYIGALVFLDSSLKTSQCAFKLRNDILYCRGFVLKQDIHDCSVKLWVVLQRNPPIQVYFYCFPPCNLQNHFRKILYQKLVLNSQVPGKWFKAMAHTGVNPRDFFCKVPPT